MRREYELVCLLTELSVRACEHVLPHKCRMSMESQAMYRVPQQVLLTLQYHLTVYQSVCATI